MIKVNPSKWEYLKESTLKRKRTKICITCNHFRYSTTETFATVLICPRYEKRIPQGDHLLKGCEYWQKNRMIFSPEAKVTVPILAKIRPSLRISGANRAM